MKLPTEIYDSIPVYYCQHCLSLKIKDVDGIPHSEYCCDCGSTNISKTDIDQWEELYFKRYKHKYLENNGKKCR